MKCNFNMSFRHFEAIGYSSVVAVYGYPNVGRFGLGHSLLAWARCTVWCAQTGATMLGPIWLRPRIGPYLRRERDKREYFRLFTNRPYPNRLSRTHLLLTKRQVAADALITGARPKDGDVVVFTNAYSRNFETYFHEIVEHGPMLRGALEEITRPSYRPAPIRVAPFIAVHVRMGDFQTFNPMVAATGAHNQQLPITWYRGAILALWEALGRQVPARVYSDGSDEALAPLLSIPGVERAEDGAAITHLLEMTDAAGLIAAGSGFSFWSAFLGHVPRIVFPGQDFGGAQAKMPTATWMQDAPGLTAEICQAIEHRL